MMVGLKVYLMLILSEWLLQVSGEPPDVFLGNTQVSTLIPDRKFRPWLINIISVRKVKFLGIRLDEDSEGLVEALKEKKEVRDSLDGRILFDCWWIFSSPEGKETLKTAECAVEESDTNVQIKIRIENSERILKPFPCLENQYFDLDHGCILCDVSCATCTNATSCVVCAPNYTRVGVGLCVWMCLKNCVKCRNNHTCSTCDIGYRWTGTTCEADDRVCSLVTCLSGTYRDSNGYCKSCPPNCSVCTDASNCYRCSSGYGLNKDYLCQSCPSSCLACVDASRCTTCRNGYGLTEDGDCRPCTSNCRTCLTASRCTECVSRYVLNAQSNCVSCPENCLSCIDQSHCRQCEIGYNLNWMKLCHQCPSACEVCGDQANCTQCFLGYVLDENNTCKRCSNNCMACTTESLCTKCTRGFVMTISNTCQSCSSGYWQQGDICAKCIPNCAKCSDGESCDLCESGYEYQDALRLCLSMESCPSGEWNESGTCSSCDPSCSSCRNSTACLVCSQNYISQGPGFLCIAQCASNQFLDPNSKSCKSCDQSCQSCLNKETCVECRDGYFADYLPGPCSKCDISCATCTGNSRVCATCSISFIPVTSLPGLCTNSCDRSCNGCASSSVTCTLCAEGFYAPETLPSPCLPCTDPCASCIYANDICLTCIKDYFPKSELPGSCTNVCDPSCSSCTSSPSNCISCSAGYYSTSLPGICAPCSSSCRICSSSANMCANCNNGFFPVNGLPGLCTECDMSCQTCSESTTNCIVCAPGYFSTLESPGACSPCDFHCDKCANTANNCLQCAFSYYPATTLPGFCTNVCAASCKRCSRSALLCDLCTDGYYAIEAFPAICIPCDKTCATCSGVATHCIDCGIGYFPVIDVPGECTNRCDESCLYCSPNATICTVCAQDYFAVSTLPGQCTKVCDISCTGCSGVSTSCVACASGYYGVGNAITNSCSPCYPSCATCIDAGAFSCTSCKEHSTLSETKTCECDIGYYWDQSLEGCETCDPSCAACSGNLPTECTVCPTSFTLSASKCVCAAGSFLDSISHTCKTCDPTCDTCSGLSPSECLTCDMSQALVGGSCICQGTGFFNNKGVCTPCYAGCKTCSSTENTQCLSCYNSAVLLTQPGPSPCVCKSGFYYDTLGFVCAPCHSSCKSCTGPSPLNCLTCKGYSNLGGLFCEQYCPNTFYGFQGACVESDSVVPIMDLPINTLLSPLSDTINHYVSYSGSNDDVQPYVVYDQGIQLSGTQFVILPPNTEDSRDIVLPPNFSIDIWVRPSQISVDTCLLSKFINQYQILSLCIENGVFVFTTKLYQIRTTGIPESSKLFESAIATDSRLAGGNLSSASINIWTEVLMTISSKVSSTGTWSVDQSILVNGVMAASQVVNNSFFRDFSSSDGIVKFTMGALGQTTPVLGFIGAIAELVISMGLVPPAPTSCGCSSCTQSGLCLLTCLPTEFFLSGVCEACASQCTHGCLHSVDCILSLDPLCHSVIDFNVCSECKSLATFSGKKCKCVKYAKFNDATNTCECDLNRSETNDCVPCLNYYQSNEVTASITTGNTLIFLDFNRNLLLSPLQNCQVIFTPEVYAQLGTNPVCIPIGLKQIRLTLGWDFTFRSGSLDMNPIVVSSSVGICNYNPAPLTPSLTIGNVSPPTAVIDAPGTYSISCGTDSNGLTLSGQNSISGVEGTLQFKWDLSTAEEGVLITTFSSYSPAQSSITLPNNILFQSILTAVLSVKDIFGNQESTAVFVSITVAPSLSLKIDGGNSATVTTSRTQVFSAEVYQGCNITYPIYSFDWTYIGSPGQSSERMNAVLQTQENGKFTIAAGALQISDYQFLCTARDQTNTVGTIILAVKVKSSPLVISCTRNGGPLAPSEQLTIDCSQSYDPDDLNAPVSALWTCASNTTICIDSSSRVLAFDSTSLILEVDANLMKPGMTYTFEITIGKEGRMQSNSLSFYIMDEDGLTIDTNIDPRTQLSNIRPVVVTPSIQTYVNAQLTWVDVGNPVLKNVPQSLPYTSVPSGQFPYGGTFDLQLSIKINTSQVDIPISLDINNPPFGGTFSVSPSSGVAMTTSFDFLAMGQIDPDGTDYPLTKGFGYQENGSYKLFSEPQYGASLHSILFSGNLSLFTKVCDSAGSCVLMSTTVSVSNPGRRLQATDQVLLFDLETVNQSLVPMMCVMFAKSFNVTQTVWEHVLGAMNQFAASFGAISDNQLMAYLSCYEALLSVSTCQTPKNLNQIIQSIETVTSQYQDLIYDTIFTRQLEAVQSYPPSHQSDWLYLHSYYDQIMSAYLNTNLPQQTQFTYKGDYLRSYLQRVIGSAVVSASFEVGNCRVNSSDTFLMDLGLDTSSVLDLDFREYSPVSFPAGVVSISITKTGIWNRLSWISAAAQDLIGVKLTIPVNVSIPIYNRTAFDSGIQCMALSDALWVAKNCQVLSNSSEEALVAVTSLGIYTLVSADVNIGTEKPIPIVTRLGQGCDRYYAPVWIMVALTGTAFAGLAVLLIRLVIISSLHKSSHSSDSRNSDLDQLPQSHILFPSCPSELHISVPFEISNVSSNLQIKVPNEHSSASSNLHISVPEERSEDSSNLRISVPDEINSASSNLRIEIPYERSSASSNLQISVPGELSGASDIYINVPGERSASSSDGRIDVPAERSVGSAKAPIGFPEHINQTLSNVSNVPDERNFQDGCDPPESGSRDGSRIPMQPAKKSEEEEVSIPVLTFKEFLAGHYLLGLLLYHKSMNLLCLLTVLLSDLFFLGVFYYYIDVSHVSSPETDISDFFSNYGKDDILYYIWSFLITTVLSLVFTTLLNLVNPANHGKGWKIAGFFLCVLTCGMCLTLTPLLNTLVCYESAGRWSVGFLWEFLTEVLILEFIVAGYRLLLLRLTSS